MAELEFPLTTPPNENASPWISSIECPISAVGNGGPNGNKKEKGTVKEMPFHVRHKK